MDFISHGIVRKMVKSRWRECLSYSTVDEKGKRTDGGLITLDKVWLFCCISPAVTKDTWIRLRYYSELQMYGFPDPKDKKDGPYTAYKKLIDMVDVIIVERNLI
jgi:hypothetical protein